MIQARLQPKEIVLELDILAILGNCYVDKYFWTIYLEQMQKRGHLEAQTLFLFQISAPPQEKVK